MSLQTSTDFSTHLTAVHKETIQSVVDRCKQSSIIPGDVPGTEQMTVGSIRRYNNELLLCDNNYIVYKEDQVSTEENIFDHFMIDEYIYICSMFGIHVYVGGVMLYVSKFRLKHVIAVDDEHFDMYSRMLKASHRTLFVVNWCNELVRLHHDTVVYIIDNLIDVEEDGTYTYSDYGETISSNVIDFVPRESSVAVLTIDGSLTICPLYSKADADQQKTTDLTAYEDAKWLTLTACGEQYICSGWNKQNERCMLLLIDGHLEVLDCLDIDSKNNNCPILIQQSVLHSAVRYLIACRYRLNVDIFVVTSSHIYHCTCLSVSPSPTAGVEESQAIQNHRILSLIADRFDGVLIGGFNWLKRISIK